MFLCITQDEEKQEEELTIYVKGDPPPASILCLLSSIERGRGVRIIAYFFNMFVILIRYSVIVEVFYQKDEMFCGREVGVIDRLIR